MAGFNLQTLRDRLPLDRLRNTSSHFSNLRPPQEFFALSRLSKPATFTDLQARVNYNLGYFASNYAVVFAMLSIYSLLTNLLLLFVIVLVVGGLFGISQLNGQDLVLPFARLSSTQLYTGLLVVAFPLFIFASPLSTVFFLVGASAVTIGVHASFLEPPVEAGFGDIEAGRASISM